MTGACATPQDGFTTTETQLQLVRQAKYLKVQQSQRHAGKVQDVDGSTRYKTSPLRWLPTPLFRAVRRHNGPEARSNCSIAT